MSHVKQVPKRTVFVMMAVIALMASLFTTMPSAKAMEFFDSPDGPAGKWTRIGSAPVAGNGPTDPDLGAHVFRAVPGDRPGALKPENVTAFCALDMQQGACNSIDCHWNPKTGGFGQPGFTERVIKYGTTYSHGATYKEAPPQITRAAAVVPVANQAQFMYVLNHWGATYNARWNGQESQAVNYALVSLTQGGLRTHPDFLHQNASPAVKARAASILQNSAVNKGPYKTTGSFDLDPDVNVKKKGKIVNAGVLAGNGNHLAGKPFTITLSGPVKFSDGTTTLKGTTTSTGITKDIVLTGDGDIAFTIDVFDLPKMEFILWEHQVVQDMWRVPWPSTTKVSGRAQAHPDMSITDLAITSQVGSKEIDDTYTDTLTVKPVEGSKWTIPANSSVKVKAEVYESAVALPEGTDPGSAKKVGETTLNFAEPGSKSFTSADAKFTPKPGMFYYTVASIKKAEQGDLVKPQLKQDYITNHWILSETSIPRKPIKLTTEFQATRTDSGDIEIADKVVISGVPEGHGSYKGGVDGWPKADNTQGTNSLYFFPAGTTPSDEALKDMKPLAQQKFTIKNGEQVVKFPGHTITAKSQADNPGTYVFVVDYPGDEKIKPFKSSATDKKEQYKVNEPTFKTTALDNADKNKVVPSLGTVEIIDTIAYTNLVAGQEYTAKGTLMDKDSGKPIQVGGKPITSSAKFTPKGKEGSLVSGKVDVLFTFDASKVPAGKRIVVFEDVYFKDVKVGTHADLEDANQTVYYPGVITKASELNQRDSGVASSAQDFVQIRDLVTYKDLQPGQSYRFHGTLMDYTTKKPFLLDGKQLTAEKVVKASASGSGEAPLDWKIPSAKLPEGATFVVFQEVYHQTSAGANNTPGGTPAQPLEQLVAVHKDLHDANQTVHVPVVGTTAVDSKDGDQLVNAVGGPVTITDRVMFRNIRAGEPHTVKGTLMDKATGKPIMVDGKPVTSEVTFTPKTGSGTVAVDFVIKDPSVLAGKTTVVFEELHWNNRLVAIHADIEDEGQTIWIPKVRTLAVDGADSDKVASSLDPKVLIIDTVSYKGIQKGQEYTLEGSLMNQGTGKPVVVDGKPVVVKRTFTPKSSDGKVDMTFTVPTSAIEGTATVVFEKIYLKGNLVTEHSDINDKDQTVYTPKVGTTARDGHAPNKPGAQLIPGHDVDVVIRDTVAYSGVQPGEEFTISGVLMNQSTGEPWLFNGKPVKASAKFTPDAPSGTQDVDFKFSAKGQTLEGVTLVVFEELIYSGASVAEHKDLKDEGQTVYIPNLKTNASDVKDGDQFGDATDETITIRDAVSYTNLKVGKEYTISGKLMDQRTGEPVLIDGQPIVASDTFTAEEPSGTRELLFEITDPSVLAGTTTVVFEDLHIGKKYLTSHADLSDVPQTVWIPKAGTTALDSTDGDQFLDAHAPSITIVDTVGYTNLQAGKEYTVKGILMDRETGEPVIVDGAEVVGETTFVAEEEDGEVQVVFEITNPLELEDTVTVVFEDIFHEGKLVTSHADLTDESQTLWTPKIRTHASDGVDADKFVSPVAESVEIVDNVSLSSLIPGKTYTVSGVLMVKGSGDPLLVDDDQVTASTTFSVDEEGTVTILARTANGVEVPVDSDNPDADSDNPDADSPNPDADSDESHTIPVTRAQLAEYDIVGCSSSVDASGKAGMVCTTADGLTLRVVDAGATADGGIAAVSPEAVADQLEEPGSPNEPVDPADNPADNSADGVDADAPNLEGTVPTVAANVDIRFMVTDPSVLLGKTTVVFEDLFHEDILITSHADLEDADQTVYSPKVTTKATEHVMLGEPASDVAVVEGDLPEEPVVLSFEAYNAKEDGEGTPVCEDANKVFSTEFGEISEAGEYTSESTVFSSAGKKWWVESLHTKDGNLIHRGECGLPNETTIVEEIPPELPYTGASTLGAWLALLGIGTAAGGAYVWSRKKSAA